jgi:thiol-disulfide isomerase/thioredoxin
MMRLAKIPSPFRPGRILLAAVVLLTVPVAARAADLICQPNYDFCVEVDGAFPGDARFFNTQERRKYFIDIPETRAGLLMDLEAKKMFAVPRSRISRDGDSGLKVQDNLPPGTTAYAFSIEGPVIQFEAEDRKVRVMPVLMRPPVVGEIAMDALIADRPEYQAGMKLYSTDPTAMMALSKYSKPLELEVYFATWCSHCKLYMPKLLRVLKDARNPNIKVTLVGLPKKFTDETGPWRKPDIQTIPTVIVKSGGREITRLGTHEGVLPEVELAGIIQALR